MLTLNDGRKEMYQWDIGRIATVGVECDVVHFSNLKYGGSLSVEVKNGEVAIPNKLLTSGEPIYCWAFVADENGNYTKQEQTLNVNKRAKPSDYVYTETETLTWKSLDERITELEKGGTGGSDAVKYTEQELTDEQKAQARTNIGAVSVNEVPIATNDVAGVVKPVSKTDEMTQPVGVDGNGALFTVPPGGSGISIDDTLTISGAAADAKATGDQIRALSDEIANIPGGSGYGDMQKSVYDPNNRAKDMFKYADDAAKLAVTNHELVGSAHSDIRNIITGLTNRLNALADSDDETLDQLSEIVTYIKSNKSLIDAITTNKVSVSDIVDNLTTNATNKPLSAAQGVALKALIDGITIPEKLPNPNALTFTGAVTGSYNGSEAMTVEIPSGGGGGITGFRRVVDTTLTEAAEIVNLTTDINGNTFSLSECYLFIEAACTEPAAITYIPNGYWTAGTYMISGSKTATDYPYTYIAYACGGSDHFFGFELKHRTGISMPNYISNKSANWEPITSYKLAGKFAEGARFIIFGRDA